MATFVYGDFEWDEEKAAANEAKHGVRFEEAAHAFTYPYSVDLADATSRAVKRCTTIRNGSALDPRS